MNHMEFIDFIAAIPVRAHDVPRDSKAGKFYQAHLEKLFNPKKMN